MEATLSAVEATPSAMESTNDYGSESSHAWSASRLKTSVARCDIGDPSLGTSGTEATPSAVEATREQGSEPIRAKSASRPGNLCQAA